MMDPIEHHPPHRDGYYEDDVEIRFVVSISKRIGEPLGPNDPDKTLSRRKRIGPSDFGRIRKAILTRAFPDGLPRAGGGPRNLTPRPYDPTTMIDVNLSGSPKYMPPAWRVRGPSVHDPKEGPPPT